MGLKNLAAFSSQLESILGDRGLGSGKTKNWINTAYFELTGGFDFEELHETSKESFAIDQEDVLLPTDLQWLRSCHNDTEKEAIIGIDEDNFWLLEDKPDGGKPEHWTRLGNSLRIWPKTDAVITLRINYNKFPPKLDLDKDVTLLTPTWDRAIEMFAIYHATLDLGEEVRAAEWLSRGMAYVRSRLLQQEMLRGPREGLRFPRSRDEFRQIRRSTRRT